MTFAQSIIAYLVSPVLSLLVFLIFIEVVFSWLVAFNVVNLRNPAVAQIYEVVRRFTEPILRPIRNAVPSIGGLDFSPIIAILGLSWLNDYVVRQLLFPALG